jgi:hypothetical protein
MVDAITGSSGLLDPKDVEKLQLLDPTIVIPSSRIGISTEQAMAAMQNELQTLYDMSGKLSAAGLVTGDNRLVAANRLAAKMHEAIMALSSPGHDPQAVLAKYKLDAAKIQMELMPTEEAALGGHQYEKVD